MTLRQKLAKSMERADEVLTGPTATQIIKIVGPITAIIIAIGSILFLIYTPPPSLP